MFFSLGDRTQVLRGSSARQQETRTCWGASSFPSWALCQELSRRVYISVGFFYFLWLGWGLQLSTGDLKNFRVGYYMTGSFLFALILRFFRHGPLLRRGCKSLCDLRQPRNEGLGDTCLASGTVGGAVHRTLETCSFKHDMSFKRGMCKHP